MRKLIIVIDLMLSILFTAMIVIGVSSIIEMKNTPSVSVGVLVIVAGIVGIIGSVGNIRRVIVDSRAKRR